MLAKADLEHLEVHLQCRLSGQVRDLHLVPSPGGVILQGRTHTYYAKQLAQHALMEATELRISANDIEVR